MKTDTVDKMRDDRIFIAIVFTIFLVVCFMNILHHEMWRDEMEVWTATYGSSLQDIIKSTKESGHPAIWYLIVKAVQQITPSPFGMAFANMLFIALAVFVLLKYSPFNRLQKSLLCFGYFILYEYGTIARNYGISVFLIFVICALYEHRERYTIHIAVILALICSAHSMNLIIMSSFVFLFAAEALFDIKSSGRFIPRSHLLLGAIILMAGILLALYQALPAEDSPWSLSSSHKWVFHRPHYALMTIWRSFIPISYPVRQFWNTNIFPDGPVMILLSLLILIISCLMFIRKPIVCVFFLLGEMSFLVFFYKVYHGFTRSHGYLFIMFVISYWVSSNFASTGNENFLTRLSKGLSNRKFNFFTFICFMHFIAVFVPIYFDWNYPFSGSREVGRYLVRNDLQDCLLAGDRYAAVVPVAGWINREMYFPEIDDHAKSVIWNHPNRNSIPPPSVHKKKDYVKTIIRKVERLAHEQKKDVILILNYAIDEEPLKSFTTSIVPDETYYIYKIQVH